ncbi:hypothetical protein GG344DRAFT_70449 [Lentinula edodes]|nr:hypothetical protein GG344DRAFT_70449 [Lentinula edodes]
MRVGEVIRRSGNGKLSWGFTELDKTYGSFWLVLGRVWWWSGHDSVSVKDVWEGAEFLPCMVVQWPTIACTEVALEGFKELLKQKNLAYTNLLQHLGQANAMGAALENHTVTPPAYTLAMPVGSKPTLPRCTTTSPFVRNVQMEDNTDDSEDTDKSDSCSSSIGDNLNTMTDEFA